MYNITPYPDTILTLLFFCAHLVTTVSYKTIKVYLVGLQLAHLERGQSNPTNNEFLYLLIRGIHQLYKATLHVIAYPLQSPNFQTCFVQLS